MITVKNITSDFIGKWSVVAIRRPTIIDIFSKKSTFNHVHDHKKGVEHG